MEEDYEDDEEIDWMHHAECCVIPYRDEQSFKKDAQRKRALRGLL